MMSKGFICVAISLSTFLVAKEFDVQGVLFPVSEPNLFESLTEYISQAENLTMAGERFHSLPPILRIRSTQNPRTFSYDPSTVSQRDVLEEEGKIVLRKGESYNPLEDHQLISPLLFIDGSKPDQVEWARVQDSSARWILVGGDPIQLTEEESRQVYFDQGGVYSKKLGISQVPAIVEQEGSFLKIREVKP